MSPELKLKLATLTRQQYPTKHKMRRVWDVVIQGNIGEVESAVKLAVESMEQNDIDFRHLFHQFPNSRYVARAYTKFLRDVACDHARWMEMREITLRLQRGILVNMDETHEFGMATFPDLPETTKYRRDPQVAAASDSSQSAQEMIREVIGEDQRVDFDHIIGLRQRIDELQIPAVSGVRKIRFVVIFIVGFCPLIFGLIFVHVFKGGLPYHIEFLTKVAVLSVYATQMSTFTVRLVAEAVGFIRPQTHMWPQDQASERLGGSWDTRDQIQSILYLATSAIEDLTAFRDYVQSYDAMSAFYRELGEFTYFSSSTNSTKMNVTIESALMEFVIEVGILVKENLTLAASSVNLSQFLTIIANLQPLSRRLQEVRELMRDEIRQLEDQSRNVVTIIEATVVVVVCVTGAASLIFEVGWIKSNKQEAYRCLIVLPKSVVSGLCEALRSSKQEAEPEVLIANLQAELNTQDDNMLKIFNAVGSSAAGISDMLFPIGGTILLTCLISTAVFVLCFFIGDSVDMIRRSAPYAYYICDSYTNSLLGFYGNMQLLLVKNGWPISVEDTARSFDAIYKVFASARMSYRKLSYGDRDSTAFDGLPRFLSLSEEARNCTELADTQPKTHIEAIRCFPADLIFALIEPVIDQDLREIELNLTGQGTANHDLYDFLWHSLITPIYTHFFMPMLESVVPSTLAELSSRETQMIIPNVVVLICMLVIEIIIWVLLGGIASHIKTVLRMVLACPADTLMANAKIMRVLSGDFSVQVSDSIDQDVEFFEAIFMALPTPTLFASSELTIQNTNLAFQKLFPSTEEKRLTEFFTSPEFDGIDPALFESSHDTKTNPGVIYHPDGQTQVHIELTVGFSGNYVIVVCKHVDDLFEYEKIIKHETKMRTELLQKLLPGVLVRRMIDDSERNSGFAVVQCASIIFMNLVKFSAWVSGVDAARALSVLNGMFARFDQILAAKSSMLRIKTFGDTYMAAGGIFSEVNQPHEHATQAVTFGLEAIKEVAKFNDEAKLNLAIRAGEHTGGPVFTGIMPMTGPTFEILGSTVKVAMRLERDGVPGAVLVSRGVYELLDRSAFSIMEKAASEGKGAAMEPTYVVREL